MNGRGPGEGAGEYVNETVESVILSHRTTTVFARERKRTMK
jgi:hypothetical protein